MAINPIKLKAGLPDDPELLAAIGAVTLRHSQLDHILRMTIKSFLGVTVEQGLDATNELGSSHLRETIKTLAKQRFPVEALRLQVGALVGKAKRATNKRNELIHNVWALDKSTDMFAAVVKKTDHLWHPPPTVDELKELEEEIAAVIGELNVARLRGWLHDALKAYPAKPLPAIKNSEIA